MNNVFQLYIANAPVKSKVHNIVRRFYCSFFFNSVKLFDN